VTNAGLETAVGQYVLDKSVSTFTVRAFATGMLASMGHNPTIAIRDFTGEASFDLAAPEESSLRIEIRADSLEVTDDIKSKDREEMESVMNQKVLESAKYPTIAFEGAVASANQLSEGRFQMRLNGTLTLHGVTGRVPVTVQVACISDTLRASGEFALLQSSFGIPIVSIAAGALKLKDELKFNFDIVARKQES
jgi:polyisoprenoid-binding protein YceI